MNYRHTYHAGNFADVLKHIVLCRLVGYLTHKDKPFFVLDSHAGRGAYDLGGDEARRTQEAEYGIARILGQSTEAPSEVLPYLDLVRGMNPSSHVITNYPGSPLIIKKLLRTKDRLVAVELHPEDAKDLRRVFRGDPQARVEVRDGYEAIKALLPPPERRGLVLIDPPFERADEFQCLIRVLKEAERRWVTGTYAIWYPIKTRPPVDKFLKALRRFAFKEIWVAELAPFSFDHLERLNGCGLALINPPYTLGIELNRILPWLCRILSREPGASWRVERLIPQENHRKGVPPA
ncbi:MAG: 23S rRNA (adenine(2030)-N(6))-methyltransferase RlmJ [Alphaproteobacteria bacterium]